MSLRTFEITVLALLAIAAVSIAATELPRARPLDRTGTESTVPGVANDVHAPSVVPDERQSRLDTGCPGLHPPVQPGARDREAAG